MGLFLNRYPYHSICSPCFPFVLDLRGRSGYNSRHFNEVEKDRDMITRKDFIGGGVAMAAVPAFASAGGSKRRWFKGNLHCHTYWSDGRAFPDQTIKSYRDAGYDFCAITDLNRMGEDCDFWRKVAPEGFFVCRRALARRLFCRFDFPAPGWARDSQKTQHKEKSG